jgi:serine/threonine-protein kinase/endoribonuclease IRE1
MIKCPYFIHHIIYFNLFLMSYFVESSASWSWEEKSKTHRERFQTFLEYGREHPEEIKEISGVRFCPSKEFCIGRGSDGTRVYIGLGKDGYERAVKRLHKDQCRSLAKHEKKMLNELNTATSKHTIKYWSHDDESDKEFVHLILDLCEETLEEYVKRNSWEDLLAIAPDVICQIVEGVSDLHQKPTAILHRDLKPSNIMRNVQDRWLLADFGISRTLPPNQDTLVSKQRGNEHWRAVESYSSEESSHESRARYKKESDIQTVGMVAYFIVSKGEHAFGTEGYQVSNLLAGNPVGLNNIKDPALKDLLGWMLSHIPEERPAAKEARKHPYLQPTHEKFELLCTMGNIHEIKSGDCTCNVTRQINSDPKDWRLFIDAAVYQYLCTDPKKLTPNRYSSKWTDCLRLIRNANLHWKDPKSIPRPKSIEGEPQDYFLKIFPTLPVTVHRILRSCDWKEREEFKRFFT